MTDTTTALIDDLVAQAQAVRQLAEQVIDRRHDRRTPAWLEREMKARKLPNGDTIPLKIYGGTPDQWLHQEAVSWCDYIDYLEPQVDKLVEHAAQLTEPGRTSAQQRLAAAKTDWQTARTVWKLIADR
jgi:hypothetical protein